MDREAPHATPPATPPRSRRSRIPRWITLVGLTLAAVAVVFVATRPLGTDEPAPEFVAFASAVPGLRLGQLAPGTAQAGDAESLVLTDLDGAPVTLADYANRPIWLVFWKTACEPCEAEAPDVDAAYAAHQADGLVVLGINVWDPAAVAQDYLTVRPIPYPVTVDPTGAFRTAYGLWGAPTHYFVDADGVIRDRFFGPITRAAIEESLAKIL